MICQFDPKAECWMAAGRGYLRPIVVEAETRSEAIKAYGKEHYRQQGEDYAMEQSMSHLSDVNSPDWTPTSGYEYEQ